VLRRSTPIFVAIAGLVVLAVASAASAAANTQPGASSSSLIAFDTRYSAEVSHIYTVRPDGSDLQQLTHSTQRGAWDPSFSPDGTHIAFARDGRNGSGIAIMGTDGTGPHRVRADTGHDDFAPAWTPDGTGIVFVRCSFSPGYPCRIARMAVDGTHLVELTHGYWHDGTGSFGSFPGELGPAVNDEDGQIAFSSDRGGYDGRLFVMDANGAGLHAITRPALGAGDPSWSQEGVWISLTGDPDVGTTFLAHPDGSDLHPIEVGVLFAMFGPTGRYLVGLQESSGSLVTFSAAGGPVTVIPGTAGATFSDWSFVP
jgi:Tol biopolymer transport system component